MSHWLWAGLVLLCLTSMSTSSDVEQRTDDYNPVVDEHSDLMSPIVAELQNYASFALGMDCPTGVNELHSVFNPEELTAYFGVVSLSSIISSESSKIAICGQDVSKMPGGIVLHAFLVQVLFKSYGVSTFGVEEGRLRTFVVRDSMLEARGTYNKNSQGIEEERITAKSKAYYPVIVSHRSTGATHVPADSAGWNVKFFIHRDDAKQMMIRIAQSLTHTAVFRGHEPVKSSAEAQRGWSYVCRSVGEDGQILKSSWVLNENSPSRKVVSSSFSFGIANARKFLGVINAYITVMTEAKQVMELLDAKNREACKLGEEIGDAGDCSEGLNFRISRSILDSPTESSQRLNGETSEVHFQVNGEADADLAINRGLSGSTLVDSQETRMETPRGEAIDLERLDDELGQSGIDQSGNVQPSTRDKSLPLVVVWESSSEQPYVSVLVSAAPLVERGVQVGVSSATGLVAHQRPRGVPGPRVTPRAVGLRSSTDDRAEDSIDGDESADGENNIDSREGISWDFWTLFAAHMAPSVEEKVGKHSDWLENQPAKHFDLRKSGADRSGLDVLGLEEEGQIRKRRKRVGHENLGGHEKLGGHTNDDWLTTKNEHLESDAETRASLSADKTDRGNKKRSSESMRGQKVKESSTRPSSVKEPSTKPSPVKASPVKASPVKFTHARASPGSVTPNRSRANIKTVLPETCQTVALKALLQKVYATGLSRGVKDSMSDEGDDEYLPTDGRSRSYWGRHWLIATLSLYGFHGASVSLRVRSPAHPERVYLIHNPLVALAAVQSELSGRSVRLSSEMPITTAQGFTLYDVPVFKAVLKAKSRLATGKAPVQTSCSSSSRPEPIVSHDESGLDIQTVTLFRTLTDE